MKVDERLRFYLYVLMQNTFQWHKDLGDLALRFLLGPGKGSIRDRCHHFAYGVEDEHFHELSSYVLNYDFDSLLSDNEKRMLFVRALKMFGFEAGYDKVKGVWYVQPKFGPETLEEEKEEVKTLLEKLGFDSVQRSLNIAEEQYIKGAYAQSLWNSRKALENLFISLSNKSGIDSKDFLSKFVKSKSARDLIKKIDGYACKGHATKLPEHEAIFGYHLVISAIYYLLLLFSH